MSGGSSSLGERPLRDSNMPFPGCNPAPHFTAGLDNEQHGLLGSLTPVARGTPEGPAEAQAVVAALDVVQIDINTLLSDIKSGASQSTIAQDRQTLNTDIAALVQAEQQFAQDSRHDLEMAAWPAVATGHDAPTQAIDRLFAAGWRPDVGHTSADGFSTQALDQLFATDWS